MDHPRLYPGWEPAILTRLSWLSTSPEIFHSGGYNEPSNVEFLSSVFRLSSVQHGKGPKAATAQHPSLCQCWQEEESESVAHQYSSGRLWFLVPTRVGLPSSESLEKHAGVLVICSSHGKLTLCMHFALGNFAVFCS